MQCLKKSSAVDETVAVRYLNSVFAWIKSFVVIGFFNGEYD
jgi:hypothetical protein